MDHIYLKLIYFNFVLYIGHIHCIYNNVNTYCSRIAKVSSLSTSSFQVGQLDINATNSERFNNWNCKWQTDYRVYSLHMCKKYMQHDITLDCQKNILSIKPLCRYLIPISIFEFRKCGVGVVFEWICKQWNWKLESLVHLSPYIIYIPIVYNRNKWTCVIWTTVYSG